MPSPATRRDRRDSRLASAPGPELPEPSVAICLRASPWSGARRSLRTSTSCARPAFSDGCSARAKQEPARGRPARSEVVQGMREGSPAETFASSPEAATDEPTEAELERRKRLAAAAA